MFAGRDLDLSGDGEPERVRGEVVTDRYPEILGIVPTLGRAFTYDEANREGTPARAMIGHGLWTRRYGGDPAILGRTIQIGATPYTVVGVLPRGFRGLTGIAELWVPAAQSFQPRMRLFVKSRLDPQSLRAAVTRDVHALDPSLPTSEVKTMEDRLGDAMWRTRVSAWLLSAFAALALLLTAIGIFGVMSQTVAQRTAEIGVRMALGAQARDVLALMLGRAAAVTAAGLVVGMGCALALTRLLSALLYDVRATDPATFVTVALLLGVVALGACYVPARRATRVDAVVALRAE